MNRALKIVVWVAVFGVCAGAGAYVAAHTDPFPPGVEDPGARPTSTAPSSSPGSTPTMLPTFAVELRVDSRHEFHVGGTCETDWAATFDVLVDPDGVVTGEAEAHLAGEAVCTFDQAQVQATTIGLDIGGSLRDDVLRLTFRETAREPVGARDLGGFAKTLPEIRPSVPLRGGEGSDLVTAVRGDGDRGRFLSETRVRVTCAEGCGGL